MSDLKRIRDKIREEDKVYEILESMGCEYIKFEQGGMLITAQLPDKFHSDNKRSVQVKMNDSLSCTIRNRGDFGHGSIFDLVSYIEFDKRGKEETTKNLHVAKEYICKLLGWKQFLGGYKGEIVVKDYTASLKEIIGDREKRREHVPNDVLPEKIMDYYYPFGSPLPYKSWIEEGISYKTQVKYGVGFCLESKRVVFPIRNRFGKLIGVKGRIMKDEDDDRKYLYLYPCNTSQELFNWHNAHEHILMSKKVIIVEAEKSVMKFHSNGIYNVLAIGASDITNFQADMIKQLGLDIKVYFAYDKDKTPDEVRGYAEVLKDRKVYGIIDTKGLLDDKSSPIDHGIEVWNDLYKNNAFEIF